MHRPRFLLPAIAFVILAACSGRSTSTIPATRNDVAHRPRLGSAAIVAFPTMANAIYPSAGSGNGGAFGPVIITAPPQIAEPPVSFAHDEPAPVLPSAATTLPGVPPTVHVSSDATFNVTQLGLSATTLAVERRHSQTRVRPMDITATNSFTANGDQDFAAATNGTYIATEDSQGDFFIYTMSGTQVSYSGGTAFFCPSVNPLPICSYGASGTGSPFPADNRLAYDTGSQRWIWTALWLNATNPSATDVMAVSKTSDPTGGWYLYQFPSCGSGSLKSVDGGSDQPHMGFSSQWIAVTSACHYNEPSLAVFDKSALYAGAVLTLNTNWFDIVDPIENTNSDNKTGGNRDDPAMEYSSTINNRLYLSASEQCDHQSPPVCAPVGTPSGTQYASIIYSHIEGSVDSPVLYSGTDLLETSFPVATSIQEGPSNGTSAPDAPGCTNCIAFEANGAIHSSSVFQFNNTHSYILATMDLGDPSFGRSDLLIAAAMSDAGTATSLRVTGGTTGYGLMASEISSPLVAATTYNVAYVGADLTNGSYYPGVMGLQWNVDANWVDDYNSLEQGTLTPTDGVQTRWVDFAHAIAPIPGTSKIVVGGHTARSSGFDAQRAMYVGTVQPSPAPCNGSGGTVPIGGWCNYAFPAETTSNPICSKNGEQYETDTYYAEAFSYTGGAGALPPTFVHNGTTGTANGDESNGDTVGTFTRSASGTTTVYVYRVVESLFTTTTTCILHYTTTVYATLTYN